MNQIDRIHPKLAPYVAALRSHEFGLQGETATVENIECGSIVAKKGRRWGDRFHLRITYCTRRLTWQVLMCPNNLMKPPDFIMEDDFLADADYNLIQTHVPSLANWQPTDPKCLLKVVLELLNLYKQFQSDFLKINRESRLCLEYELLINHLNYPLSDLEIYVHNGGRASFLLNLNINFSKLPVPLPKRKCLALLLVELGENTKNFVSLIKYKEFDEFFGDINLPELNCNTMLVDYVRSIEGTLQLMVNSVVEKLNKRKMLYCYLVQALEPAILNCDNITFRNVSFLLEMNGQYYILLIEIPMSFPNDPPELYMSSMRKFKEGPKMFVQLTKFNYESRWNVEKIFRNVYDFIKKAAISQYNKNWSNTDVRHKK